MGIKAKIRLGFIAIGILLFLSGLISSLELVRFNRITHSVLEKNLNGLELSKQMLDAIQEQNTALLFLLTEPEAETAYDSLMAASKQNFDKALESAEKILLKTETLDSIRETSKRYYALIGEIDENTDINWFTQIYKNPYYDLTLSIKAFMMDTQHQTIDYTSQLEQNAYRASMVGIIALAAGVLLMLVFYFMLKNYFINPTLQITRSLKGYMDARVPFNIKVSTRDEINTLREYIASLIEANKKMKS